MKLIIVGDIASGKDFDAKLIINGEARTAVGLSEDEALCVASYALRGEFHRYLKTEEQQREFDRIAAEIKAKRAAEGPKQ